MASDITTASTPQRFFDLPRELRNKVYSHLKNTGRFAVHRLHNEVKTYTGVAPFASMLLVSRRFGSEYTAAVFSDATLTFQDNEIKRYKTPKLPMNLQLIQRCAIELFVPHAASGVQQERYLDPACNSTKSCETRTAEEDEDEIAREQDGETNTTFGDLAWFVPMLRELKNLRSIEPKVTFAEPYGEDCWRQEDSEKNKEQCLIAELGDLGRLPYLSKVEIRRVSAGQFGTRKEDSYFLGIKRWGTWSKELGWVIPEQPEKLRDAERELDNCVGKDCGNWACVGQTKMHQYPRDLTI